MTTLIGTNGNDTFYGLSANADPADGVDTITGGAGSDTYSLAQLTSTQPYFIQPPPGIRFDIPLIPDVVTDFQTGAGGDAIDIYGLLNGLPAYPYFQFNLGSQTVGPNPFAAGFLRLHQSGPDTL